MKSSTSVASLVKAVVREGGITDPDTVVYAVQDARPGASVAQIRKTLASEITRASEARNR